MGAWSGAGGESHAMMHGWKRTLNEKACAPPSLAPLSWACVSGRVWPRFHLACGDMTHCVSCFLWGCDKILPKSSLGKVCFGSQLEGTAHLGWGGVVAGACDIQFQHNYTHEAETDERWCSASMFLFIHSGDALLPPPWKNLVHISLGFPTSISLIRNSLTHVQRFVSMVILKPTSL